MAAAHAPLPARRRPNLCACAILLFAFVLFAVVIARAILVAIAKPALALNAMKVSFEAGQALPIRKWTHQGANSVLLVAHVSLAVLVVVAVDVARAKQTLALDAVCESLKV